jgi:hypothetical protein
MAPGTRQQSGFELENPFSLVQYLSTEPNCSGPAGLVSGLEMTHVVLAGFIIELSFIFTNLVLSLQLSI